MKNDKKDANFKKITERYDQRFKVLINKPDFQKDIAAFRKKWNIDPSELQKADNEQSWWHKHYDSDDAWRQTVWPKYRADLEAMEAAAFDLNNKQVDYRQYVDRKAALWGEKPINAFYADLNSLLKKYKLPPKWQQALQSYIFTNEEKYRGSVGLIIKSNMDITDNDDDTVSVVLDAHTTRKDLIDAWPRIKVHLDKLQHKTGDKFQPFNDKVFERNKLAYELHHNKKKPLKLIAEEDFDGKYTYTDVADMIKNYKKTLGIN